MRSAVLVAAASLAVCLATVEAQQRRGGAKPAANVAFAIVVTDPTGAQVPNVSVTVEGPTPRTTRTEGGRIALEGMAPGNYLLRFEKDGFHIVERELTARGGAPIDVKVTLKPLPPPPAPPPAPPKPERPPSTAKPTAIDVPSVAEREYIDRAPQKTTPLACGADTSATLIQVNEPVGDHVHDEGDEFLYVMAGEGAASVGGGAHRLRAGVLVFVPRGVSHRFSRSGKKPLMIISTRAGSC